MGMNNWKDLEARAKKGPLSIGLKTIVISTILFVSIWLIGAGLGWFGEAAQVARQEFGPKAMLTKYEWFKDASSQLDKKLADIEVYKQRVEGMKISYQSIPRNKWDRTDKEQFNLWQIEVSGVKASYNGLAADWNAQISKFNWKPFLTDLPPGAEGVLRKQYATYIGG